MTDKTQITEALTSKKQSKPALIPAAEAESRITIHRIYLKNQQFVVSGMPDELNSNWKPEISL